MNDQMTDDVFWARAFFASISCEGIGYAEGSAVADGGLKEFRKRFPTDIDEEEVTPREAFEALKEHVAQGKYIAPKPQVPPDASEVVEAARDLCSGVTGFESQQALRDALARHDNIHRAQVPKPVAARHWEVEHCKVVLVFPDGSKTVEYEAIDTWHAAQIVVLLNRAHRLGEADAK